MSLTLTYDLLSVTLPSPQWGDTYAIDTKVLSYRSMSGDMRSYRRTGNINRLTYTFHLDFDCDATLQEDLNALLLAATGSDITMLNHESETWLVKCTTLDPSYTNMGNWWAVTLVFEGHLDA